MCSEGFTVYPFTGGICAPRYSPVPYCLISSRSGCSLCKQGYVNNYGQCQKYNAEVNCSTEGCSYCKEDNVCAQCMQGYHWVYIEKSEES